MTESKWGHKLQAGLQQTFLLAPLQCQHEKPKDAILYGPFVVLETATYIGEEKHGRGRVLYSPGSLRASLYSIHRRELVSWLEPEFMWLSDKPLDGKAKANTTLGSSVGQAYP